MFFRLALANKMIFAAGSAVTAVLVGSIGITCLRTADCVRSEVTDLAMEKAAGVAAQVGTQITVLEGVGSIAGEHGKR
ncbi:hypothetical protein MetexDRAFT_1707 [Methylorubrum extorquens DSM 13060]|jgi:hypothetical protein|uniref:Uncharacterized protein n=1 Tax=Methylorubrum extorquens DSM 13060 TaxID=882800 RepID=H1KGE5_METEX|nr:hypothetical protein MetexDRAFT_1707 [Methylorubrum extorquens DSM 13060]